MRSHTLPPPLVAQRNLTEKRPPRERMAASVARTLSG